MNKTNTLVVLFGSFFLALFVLSVFLPGAKNKTDDSTFIAQLDPIDQEEIERMEQINPQEAEIKKQQSEYYRTRWEDEEDYYRQVAPHDVDDPDFFNRPHPLQEAPLEERPLQERPLQERSLQERPLPEKLLR